MNTSAGDQNERIRIDNKTEFHLMFKKDAKRNYDHLNGIETSVDKITKEEVIRVGYFTAYFEQLHQIVELTMDIAANLKIHSFKRLTYRKALKPTRRDINVEVL